MIATLTFTVPEEKVTCVVRAALLWWESNRSCASTLGAHLATPAVNTRGPEEKFLAEAVADMGREMIRENK